MNRLVLKVEGLKSKKVKITWGKVSKTFERPEAEKGINLAAVFMEENPFKGPFRKIFAAIHERNRVLGFLRKKQFQNEGMRKRLARQLALIKITPIKHQIKIEEVN